MSKPLLIFSREFEVGPGSPYRSVKIKVGLYRVYGDGTRTSGYFLRVLESGCSRTWITQEEAMAWSQQIPEDVVAAK